MEVIILDVPEGAEERVKEMALVAIERFIRNRDVKVAEEVTTKFESDIDTIREVNSLDAKYTKEEIVEEEIVAK